MSSKHASITAAPVNIVAINISCPGQSTKLTCLYKIIYLPQTSQLKLSSFSLPKLLKQAGGGQPWHLNIFEFA